MAFTTQRGRPRTRAPETDCGTPELRLKHALNLTTEPIDLCLAQKLITTDQHWCGMHLRWLYTLRYGAPSLTTRYADFTNDYAPQKEEPEWREIREQEYQESVTLLKQQRRYETVMRICIFNELPAFLSRSLKERAMKDAALAHALTRSHHQLCDGLDILVKHWRKASSHAVTIA